MYKGNKILGIIPARGGSKGVPRKNLKPLAGKPLLAWSAAAAKASELLDRVILSSEDVEIIAAAREMGLDAPFIRPQELASDETPGIAPVLHALRELDGENYTHVALLQPTSPLREAGDIDGAIRRCIDLQACACVSVSEAPHPPWWMFRIDPQHRLLPILDAETMPSRRQDAPRAYQLNGAVYVAQVGHLRETESFLGPDSAAYVMPAERSLDIDTELDFLLAEAILRAGNLPETS